MERYFLGHRISKRSKESGLGAMQPRTMLTPHHGVPIVKSPLLAPLGTVYHTTGKLWCWAWDTRTSTTACSKLHTSTFNLMKVILYSSGFLTGSKACIPAAREAGKGTFCLFYFWGFEEFLRFGMDDHKMLVATNMATPGGEGEEGLKTDSRVSHLANGWLEILWLRSGNWKEE